MEDCISSQAEEIEALCSIYGDQWKTDDECNQAYSICISEGGQSVVLYIKLPPDYPSHSPPTYQLSAPSLMRQDKLDLSQRLETIYIDNIGENILFQWVEAVREFLQEYVKQGLVEDDSCDKSVEEITSSFASLSPEPLKHEDIPHITHGEIIVDRKSIFQGHVATVTSVDQVKLVLSTLKENKKIANATHNIYAYRIERGRGLVQDCEDDGETAAGSRLLHLLQIMDVLNVVVVVTRWYGGVHLGPDRFRHINNAARQTLELSGFVTKKK